MKINVSCIHKFLTNVPLVLMYTVFPRNFFVKNTVRLKRERLLLGHVRNDFICYSYYIYKSVVLHNMFFL